jgi:hypothetical protein
MQDGILNLLPPDIDLETKRVLKQLARSHRALAELKGFADTMPNKNILIGTNHYLIEQLKLKFTLQW